MDEEISVWILDFLLRQPAVDDGVVKLAIASLPLPPDASIPLSVKQSILLRAVSSEFGAASVSESLLDHLESLEAIGGLLGLPAPASLKDAYRAVALDCTLRYLHVGAAGSARYSAALQRIWRGRIRELEGKCGLVTAEMRSWSDRLEAALLDEDERESLMKIDGRAEAFRSLRAYLDEAYLKMGASFLEAAASSAAAAGQADTGAAADEGKNDASEVRDFANDAAGPSAGAPPNAHGRPAAESGDGRQKMAAPLCETNRGMRRHAGSGIKIVDSEESRGGIPHVGFDSLSSPTVDGVVDALKASSLELKAAVEDPLPEVLRVSASLVPDARQYVSPPTLIERNSSAQTYQWDTLEETSEERDRPELHSPKVLAVSPLRVAHPQKFTRRRPRKFWSLQEEEALREGVGRFGVGNWKLIRNCYLNVFEERREGDLKDKWRNMTR